jgi:uncharacterized alkaline shock family protein YloU
MTDQPSADYSPEVVTSYVWDAIKALPGVADLRRTPLQTLGERVHIERGGPARLSSEEGRATLDVHIAITPDAAVATLVPQMRAEIAAYLGRMTGIKLDAINIHVDEIVWNEPAAP